MIRRLLSIWLTTALVMTALPAPGQPVQEHVTGLLPPIRTLALPDGSLLVAEAGLGTTKSGRVSLVDRDRRRFTVIDQLPSGFHGPTNDPSGPTAVLLFGSRLYIPIGNGDVSIAAAGGIERVNPSPSSPLFSSILLLELPSGEPELPKGFRLPRGAHDTIASGAGAYLTSDHGQVARLSRLVDFVDYVPMPRPDVPENVQHQLPRGRARPPAPRRGSRPGTSGHRRRPAPTDQREPGSTHGRPLRDRDWFRANPAHTRAAVANQCGR